ncbi:MAG: hypothetical protein ACJ8AO_06865 [Gemmatimonadaceae bacterium]
MPDRNGVWDVVCDACGTFRIWDSAAAFVNGGYDPQRHLVSAATRRASDAGERLELSPDRLDAVLEGTAGTLDPLAAIDRALLLFGSRIKTLQLTSPINQETDWPLLGVRPGELGVVVSMLRQLGWLSVISASVVQLTLPGWERLQQLRERAPQSNRAFVAMRFNDRMRVAYNEGIAPALRATGYDPMRVDLLQYNEKIDDRIVAELRRAGIVVADFTEHAGGVYYEAGFAHGRGIPVIFACHVDDIGRAHFDTRQWNHITWSTPAELQERLEARIRATLVVYPPMPEQATSEPPRP